MAMAHWFLQRPDGLLVCAVVLAEAPRYASGCGDTVLSTLSWCLVASGVLRNLGAYFFDCTDVGGWLGANLWAALTFGCGVTSISPKIESFNESSFLSGFIEGYSLFWYHMMAMDNPEKDKYQEGVAHYEADAKASVARTFIDCGTGAHMPLARYLLKHNVASHVHAIEGNKYSYPTIDKILASDADLAQTITVHKCLSTHAELPEGQKARGLIHELIGFVASDEGMMGILADVEERCMAKDGQNIFIPSWIGTHAVPVGPPRLSLSTALLAMLLPGWRTMESGTRGMQVFHGFPGFNGLWLGAPQICEEFRFGKQPIREQMQQTTTMTWTVEKPAMFAGFIMSCFLQAYPGGPVDKPMEQRPCQAFCRMVKKGEELSLAAGDKIDMTFIVDAGSFVPKYQMNAKLTRANSLDCFAELSEQWQGAVAKLGLL